MLHVEHIAYRADDSTLHIELIALVIARAHNINSVV